MSFLETIRSILNNNPFKGFFRLNRMRPPGAVEEKKFMELCIRCARCIEVCPYESIQRADLFQSLQIGTPYIFAEERACYLCMRCTPVCPTGALDHTVKQPEKVRIGIARITEQTCYNYLYVKAEDTGKNDGSIMICSTCYNMCPLMDKAIVMKEFLLPVVTDQCTGCGICVEKCPVTPKAINIIPAGMGDKDLAGIHYLRSRHSFTNEAAPAGVLTGDELLKRKNELSSQDAAKDLKYDFNTDEKIEGW